MLILKYHLLINFDLNIRFVSLKALPCCRYKEFESLIHHQRLRPHESPDDYPWKISDSDLVANKQKVLVSKFILHTAHKM